LREDKEKNNRELIEAVMEGMRDEYTLIARKVRFTDGWTGCADGSRIIRRSRRLHRLSDRSRTGLPPRHYQQYQGMVYRVKLPTPRQGSLRRPFLDQYLPPYLLQWVMIPSSAQGLSRNLHK